MKEKILFTLTLLLTLFVLIFRIYSNKDKYATPYDPSFWAKKYSLSQWALGWEAKERLSDAELYAYNGWEIIHGGDPTRIDATVPPLGKYLIGLSIIVFKNENLQALFFGFCLLAVMFLISKKIFKGLFWSFFPVFLFSLDKLFQENLNTAMLDLPFSLFISLGFYFLLDKKAPQNFLLATLFFALSSLTKMFVVGFALYLFSLVYFFWVSKKGNVSKRFVYFSLLSILLFVFIYFSGYFLYFTSDHNLKDFLNYHLWLLKYARVSVENYPKGQIFNILLFGNWKTWWDNAQVVKVPQWNILWTISFLFSLKDLVFSLKSIFKNFIPPTLFIISFWPFFLLSLYATGVPYPRYLLTVLPPLYILFCYNLKQLFSYVQKK